MTESKECPKCAAKLPPMFSTGRLVCTKCGWSDRPKRLSHSDIPIVEAVLDKVELALDKVFPDDIELAKKKEKVETPNSTNWAGNLFSIIGFLIMMTGLFYDTSVSSSRDYSYERIVNTGRVSDRASFINVGGFFFIFGAISSLKSSKRDG